jgi:hypothetical protein
MSSSRSTAEWFSWIFLCCERISSTTDATERMLHSRASWTTRPRTLCPRPERIFQSSSRTKGLQLGGCLLRRRTGWRPSWWSSHCNGRTRVALPCRDGSGIAHQFGRGLVGTKVACDDVGHGRRGRSGSGGRAARFRLHRNEFHLADQRARLLVVGPSAGGPVRCGCGGSPTWRRTYRTGS